MARELKFLAASILVAAFCYAGTARADLPESRDVQPVVMTGGETPRLLGARPGRVVAFAWFEGWSRVPTGWFQIPVQVDERKMIDLRPVSQRNMDEDEFKTMAYADPDTWTEADGVAQTATAPGNPGSGSPIPGTAGDPRLDADDEIAMMAWDAGLPAGDRPAPEGVDPASRTSVTVTDPLDPGRAAYIYLFRSDGTLAPDAGEHMVDYERKFSPKLNGSYRSGYDFEGIPLDPKGSPANPEDSNVITSRYDTEMPGRWMLDHLGIAAGNRSDSDILDGDKLNLGMPGCARSELALSQGPGGVIADIDGPVRAIRSAISVDAEAYAQRDYLFYEGMLETRTFLGTSTRETGPVVSAMDLSGQVRGSTYRNSRNPIGVTIDGQRDELAPGPADWEQVSGDSGLVTNVTRTVGAPGGLTRSTFYEDMDQPPETSPMRCSGDAHSYGAAGPVFTLPPEPSETDDRFGFIRYSWFDDSEADANLGRLYSRQVDEPLRTEVDRPEPAILVVKATPSRLRLAPGQRRTVRVTVRNHGHRKAAKVRVCTRKAKWNRARTRCRKVRRLGRGRAITRRITVRAGRAASRRPRLLWFRAAARGARSYGDGIRIRIRRR